MLAALATAGETRPNLFGIKHTRSLLVAPVLWVDRPEVAQAFTVVTRAQVLQAGRSIQPATETNVRLVHLHVLENAANVT